MLGGIFLTSKLASLVVFKGFFGAIASFSQSTVMFNLPIRLVQETSLDLSISALVTQKHLFKEGENRRMLAPSFVSAYGMLALLFLFALLGFVVFIMAVIV